MISIYSRTCTTKRSALLKRTLNKSALARSHVFNWNFEFRSDIVDCPAYNMCETSAAVHKYLGVLSARYVSYIYFNFAKKPV